MYALNIYLLLFLIFVPIFGRYIDFNFFYKFFLNFLFSVLFIASLYCLYEVVSLNSFCELTLFNWYNLLAIEAPFILIYDKLSTTMFILVILISWMVHLFATNYMENDPSKFRFFFFLALFTFFMCFMVLSGNILQFFFAWEGVGLSSYLLINFWYTRAEANRAAIKAIIVNRFGDFGLYLVVLIFFAFYKTLNFNNINALFYLTNKNFTINFFFWDIELKTIIAALIFLAVMSKSAQLGFHTWLPDAMEGPTPVSALLHAATMVTAGVYLMLRLSPIMIEADLIMLFISFWGALTAFFASTVGAFQNDIKKIIAYSTCSQLGYMVSACGAYNFIGAYFHLFNHAFFKALLFLGAGSIIHALLDEQDLRKYGNLINFLPFTYICMFTASLSLIGFPFLSGYYSKEIILNWTFNGFEEYTINFYWLLVLAAFFTSFYSTKLLNLTFFSEYPRFSLTLLKNIKESDYRFKIPFFLLAIFSIFSGFMFFDLFIGYGTDLLYLPINLENNFLIEIEYLKQFRKEIPILFVFGGAFTYLYSYRFFSSNFLKLIKKNFLLKFFIPFKNFFNKKWFFDFFFFILIFKFLEFNYKILFKSFDKGIIEDIFVKKTIYFSNKNAKLINKLQTSNIFKNLTYFINILIFILIIFCTFYFSFTKFLLIFLIFYNFFLIIKD